jgi:hypothetical protein
MQSVEEEIDVESRGCLKSTLSHIWELVGPNVCPEVGCPQISFMRFFLITPEISG